MKILITGGCGFIGSHIVDAYLEQGHRVTVIDDLSTGSLNNLNPRAEFIKADICSPDIETMLKNQPVDIINHHAAQINVRTSVEDPLFDAKVNIMGALNILRYGFDHGMQRFIFASSGGTVYGEPTTFPITEAFPIQPTSPYGIAKATVERYLSVFAPLHRFTVVVLRYSNVYGPRQISKSEAGVISIFIENILQRKTCMVYGNGKQTRDYVFVHDVVQANIRALASPSLTINIGTGVETSVNDLIQILSNVTDRKVAREYGPARAGEVFRNVIDPAKAASELKWHPTTVLDTGIKRTFEYFKQQDAGTNQVS
ncbi:NAD-dependent epimerase/dehydratase family protein [candidate division WOR-3 bacterium]|nr:NAD-dependent epimerase/dehydratase family protein [candidate division WOR-3 bacterium]